MQKRANAHSNVDRLLFKRFLSPISMTVDSKRPSTCCQCSNLGYQLVYENFHGHGLCGPEFAGAR